MNWFEFLTRRKGGDVRMYPLVRSREGYFTPVAKGSEPHRSDDEWTQAPGRTRRERRKNWKEHQKSLVERSRRTHG